MCLASCCSQIGVVSHLQLCADLALVVRCQSRYRDVVDIHIVRRVTLVGQSGLAISVEVELTIFSDSLATFRTGIEAIG